MKPKTISLLAGLSHWHNVFQVIPFARPSSSLPTLSPFAVFILCGFCDKLKLLPRLPLPQPQAELFCCASAKDIFVFYGSYDFSISFSTSPSSRALKLSAPSLARAIQKFILMAKSLQSDMAIYLLRYMQHTCTIRQTVCLDCALGIKCEI